MRATATMTLREQVTSNTALGLGRPGTASITGKQFLASEPYQTGIAPVAVQAPGVGGQVRLLVGFPAQDVWADLTIGADGRIVAETLVDPDHLITRRFSYPGK
jgi:copper transport protein